MRKIFLMSLICVLFSILLSVNISAQGINSGITISNYGYGADLIEYSNQKDLSYYLKTYISGNKNYTRAGLRNYTKSNKTLYFWNIGFVNYTLNDHQYNNLDLGVGVRVKLANNSYINFETGYSSAIPGNIYYGISLKLDWIQMNGFDRRN